MVQLNGIDEVIGAIETQVQGWCCGAAGWDAAFDPRIPYEC